MENKILFKLTEKNLLSLSEKFLLISSEKASVLWLMSAKNGLTKVYKMIRQKSVLGE
jgi:hypothetical protein